MKLVVPYERTKCLRNKKKIKLEKEEKITVHYSFLLVLIHNSQFLHFWFVGPTKFLLVSHLHGALVGTILAKQSTV